MGDAHGRVSGVHRLAAGAGGAEGVDADILGFDLDFDFVGFGQHGDGDGRGVNAALLLGRRHALHAVHAALVLQPAVDLVAADQGDDFLQAAHRRFADRSHFHLPALRFRIARVHAEDLGGEQSGFVAAGAGADFEHHVLLVVRIFGQQQHPELLFDARQFGLQARRFLFGHGAHLGVGLLQHRHAPAPGCPRAFFHSRNLATTSASVAVRLGDFAVLLGIGDHGRIGHLLRSVRQSAFRVCSSLWMNCMAEIRR